jgi:hypothetical protein
MQIVQCHIRLKIGQCEIGQSVILQANFSVYDFVTRTSFTEAQALILHFFKMQISEMHVRTFYRDPCNMLASQLICILNQGFSVPNTWKLEHWEFKL